MYFETSFCSNNLNLLYTKQGSLNNKKNNKNADKYSEKYNEKTSQ